MVNLLCPGGLGGRLEGPRDVPECSTWRSLCLYKKNYVMFQNAGVTDFYALFLVGFTDKAADPTTIGMFGSGFKLAVAAALRFGIDLIVYLGHDKVTFCTEMRYVKDEEVQQLSFDGEAPEGAVETSGRTRRWG